MCGKEFRKQRISSWWYCVREQLCDMCLIMNADVTHSPESEKINKQKNYNDRPVVRCSLAWPTARKPNNTKMREDQNPVTILSEGNAKKSQQQQSGRNGWTVFPTERSNVPHMCYDYCERMFWRAPKTGIKQLSLFCVFAVVMFIADLL